MGTERSPTANGNQSDIKSRNLKYPKQRRCVVCGSLQEDFPGINFHRFPKDPELSDKWAEIVQKKWISTASVNQRYVNYRICQNHFQEDDYVSAKKTRLTKAAVPNLINTALLKSKLKRKLDVSAEESMMDIDTVEFSSTPIRTLATNITGVSGILNSTLMSGGENVSGVSGTFNSSMASDIETNSGVSKTHGTPVISKEKKGRRIFTPTTLQIKSLNAKLSIVNRKYQKLSTNPMPIRQILNSIKGLVSPAVHRFIASQLHNARVSKFGRRWSVEDKNFALKLYMQSPKSYFFLRRIFVLPAKSTILKCLSGMKLSVGFSETILKSFKFLASKLNSLDRKCIVSFDAMSLKQSLSFDVKHDQVIGFENFGSAFKVEKPRLATHALVFMVRGLCKKWKQVFGYFFSCESASSEILKHLLHEGVSKLVECGLEPIAVVCDQAANNIKLYEKELGISPEEPFFFVEDRKIYTLFDTPHLLKSVRNNFLKYNVKFERKGLSKVAQWQHVVEAWKFDKDLTYRFAPKLTKEHVDVGPMNKMNVKLAAQVLSQSVASILCYLSAFNVLPSAASNTADFCATMNDLFESVNSRMIKDDRPLLSAVTNTSPHMESWENFIDFIKSIKFLTPKRKNKRGINFPCLWGWLITLSAFRQMILELLIDIPYILMSRFNQDALENFFSVVRRKGGNNDHPTPINFKARLRFLMAEHLMNACNTTNCEADDDVTLIPLELLIESSETQNSELLDVNVENEIITSNDSESDVDDVLQVGTDIFNDDVHEANSGAYVAGYIAKTALKKFQCDTCRSNLVKDKELSREQMFLYFKEFEGVKQGLCAPSDSCLKTVCDFGRNFNVLFDSYCYSENISYNITQKLCKVNHDWLNCDSHRKDLWEYI